MYWIIGTRDDLVTWASNTTLGLDDNDVENVVQTIMDDPNRPNMGQNWAPYLESLTENMVINAALTGDFGGGE